MFIYMKVLQGNQVNILIINFMIRMAQTISINGLIISSKGLYSIQKFKTVLKKLFMLEKITLLSIYSVTLVVSKTFLRSSAGLSFTLYLTSPFSLILLTTSSFSTNKIDGFYSIKERTNSKKLKSKMSLEGLKMQGSKE